MVPRFSSFLHALGSLSPGFRFDLRQPLLEQILNRDTWQGGQMMMPGFRGGIAPRPMPLPPGVNRTLLMDQSGTFRRAGTPRGRVTQPKIGPMPKPQSLFKASSPPKMNRGDVGLALALSRKPRRG